MKHLIILFILAPLFLMTLTGGVMAASEAPTFAPAMSGSVVSAGPELRGDAALAFDTVRLAGKHWTRDMRTLWNDTDKNLVEKAGYGVIFSGWRLAEVGFTFTGYALQQTGLLSSQN